MLRGGTKFANIRVNSKQAKDLIRSIRWCAAPMERIVAARDESAEVKRLRKRPAAQRFFARSSNGTVDFSDYLTTHWRNSHKPEKLQRSDAHERKPYGSGWIRPPDRLSGISKGV